MGQTKPSEKIVKPPSVRAGRYRAWGAAVAFVIAATSSLGAAYACGLPDFWSRVFMYFGENSVCIILGLAIGHIIAERVRKARFREWDQYERGVCVVCGYDLRGNESRICPECGTPFDCVKP